MIQFIEVVQIYSHADSGWLLKNTYGGLIYLWTGYGWTLSNSAPKVFPTESSAKEDIKIASGYQVGI
jgi:hypothetical protein